MKYQIFELLSSDNYLPTLSRTISNNRVTQTSYVLSLCLIPELSGKDSFEEAKLAIELYGVKHNKYTIIPIFDI